MAGSETVTANARVKARVKAGATWFLNLSAALTGTGAARVWILARFDLAAFAWSVAAFGLFAIGYGLLYLLEPEDHS
jgi:hypothetical protein